MDEWEHFCFQRAENRALMETSELEEHRRHFKQLMSLLNQMIKLTRSVVFYRLVSSNQRNPTDHTLLFQSVWTVRIYLLGVLNKSSVNQLQWVQDAAGSLTQNQQTDHVPPDGSMKTLHWWPLTPDSISEILWSQLCQCIKTYNQTRICVFFHSKV